MTGEWKPIKENRGSLLKPIIIDGLIRDDGFKITREEREDGLDYMHFEVFECAGNFKSFRLQANRFKGIKPLETYTVPLSLAADRGTNNPEMIRLFAKDIESALLNFPQPKSIYINYPPIKQVLFNVMGTNYTVDEIPE